MQKVWCKVYKKKSIEEGYSAFNLPVFTYSEFWTWPVSNVGFEGAKLFNFFKWFSNFINVKFSKWLQNEAKFDSNCV